MAASTERRVPSLNSFTLPATVPAPLLATPGACVTDATRLGPPTVPSSPPAAIPADPCTVLRITLVLEARVALTLSPLRIHSVACTCDMSPDTRHP
jgi:hypothetical protein